MASKRSTNSSVQVDLWLGHSKRQTRTRYNQVDVEYCTHSRFSDWLEGRLGRWKPLSAVIRHRLLPQKGFKDLQAPRAGEVHQNRSFLVPSSGDPEYVVHSPMDSHQLPGLVHDLHLLVPFPRQKPANTSLDGWRAHNRRITLQSTRQWDIPLDQGGRTLSSKINDSLTFWTARQDSPDSARFPTRNTSSKIDPGGTASCCTCELPAQLGGLQAECVDAR